MCTTFFVKTQTGDMVIGRSTEFTIDEDSDMFFRSKGYRYNQDIRAMLGNVNNQYKDTPAHDKSLDIISNKTPPSDSLLHWEGLYGFVAMGSLKQSLATSGMNTEGLTTGIMTLGESKYQVPKDENYSDSLLFPYLTNWILSTCANCQDVIDKLAVDRIIKPITSNLTKGAISEPKYTVINPYTKDSLPGLRSHFPVQDRQGNAIVLEFINGELIITDLMPIGVLTNDPVIGWQQENVINNYMGITPVNIQGLDDSNYSLGKHFNSKTAGQGSGFTGIPGSSTPVDRFVRAAMMSNFSMVPDDTDEAIGLAFHILNTVDIPLGTSRTNGVDVALDSNNSDYTQWSCVSDLTNKVFSVRMYGSPQVFRVDLKSLDLNSLNDYRQAIPVKENQFVALNDMINSTSRQGNLT
jgi:penicillin V acylase-like amidase (Ntn superfamily)